MSTQLSRKYSFNSSDNSSNNRNSTKSVVHIEGEEILDKVELEDKVKVLTARVCQLEDQRNHLTAQIHGIVNSRSWKLTALLRAVFSAKRNLRRLFRFKKGDFNLTPFKYKFDKFNNTLKVIKNPISNSAVDVSVSSYLLEPKKETKSKRIFSSWISVKGQLSQDADDQVSYLLYYRADNEKGFKGESRQWITLHKNKSLSHIVKLPNEAVEFRIDPIIPEESPTALSVSIKELGIVNVFLWHAREQFRYTSILSLPLVFLIKLKRAFTILRSGGLTGLKMKLLGGNSIGSDYQTWIERNDTLTDDDIALIKKDCEVLNYKPLISICMPVYNSPEEFLIKAIESVRSQAYQNWELCIADDCSPEPHVRKVLERFSKKDSRIKVVFRGNNGHIAKATNSAIDLASGDYVGFLDHDDELRPHSLYMVAKELNKDQNLKIIYSDEDKKTETGLRFNPYFKSSWNPYLLLSQNYICHFLVLERSLLKEVGCVQSDYDGAQDWDLILRASEKVDREQISHIPHVLYHWRAITGSTAQSTDFKPYVLESQKKAVESHLERRGVKADVAISRDINQLRVYFSVPKEKPEITWIIPTRDYLNVLSRCVKSIIDRSTYGNYKILIVDNDSQEKTTHEYFDYITKYENISVLKDERAFNFSRLNNFAVKHIDTEYVGFANNDVEVISKNWMQEMLGIACQENVGAVGARLLYPNGLLQHGGVILGIGGIAGHNHKGRLRQDVGYFNRAILTQNLSGVTAACMLMKRSVFEEVGGFDEQDLSVAFNDVDLCLKVCSKGYDIVYTPYAELYHHESVSRGYETTPEKFARFETEIEVMKKRWSKVLLNDPYYNPNLTLMSEDFQFAYPSRAKKPWKN